MNGFGIREKLYKILDDATMELHNLLLTGGFISWSDEILFSKKKMKKMIICVDQ